jgi:hypothetical protein
MTTATINNLNINQKRRVSSVRDFNVTKETIKKTRGQVYKKERLPSNFSLSKSLISIFVLSLALYLYLVVNLVVNTINRKSTQEQISKINTELSYKKIEYSDIVKNISIKDTYTGGFVPSSNEIFAVREVDTLTYNRNE